MNKITTLGLLLVGCKGTDGNGDIWAFELPYDDTYACEDVITHNFSDGYVAEEEAGGAWTTEESTVLSPQLFFGQLETYGTDQAFLIIGTEAYPGIATEAGWKFSWIGSTESSEVSSHESGYDFTSSVIAASNVTITMQVSADTATGTWSALDNTDSSWTESDTWDSAAVGQPTGSIPSGQFLVYDFTKGQGKNKITVEGAPLTNTFEEPECSGSCELTVSSSCTGSVEFTANRADFEDEGVYQYLERAGQPHGS